MSKDYRAWQRAQTELNADGNEGRGREGEDETESIAPLHYNGRKITDEQWIDILKALNGDPGTG